MKNTPAPPPKKLTPQNAGAVKKAAAAMGKLMQQRVAPRGKRG